MARRDRMEFHAPDAGIRKVQSGRSLPELKVKLPRSKPVTLTRPLPELKVDLPRRPKIEIRESIDPVAALLSKPAYRVVVGRPVATIESVTIHVE